MIIINEKNIDNLYVTSNVVNDAFLGDKHIYPNYPEPEATTLTYRTTTYNENVLLTNRTSYFSKIMVDGIEQTIPKDKMSYTFTSPGDHSVKVKFKTNCKDLSWCFSNCINLRSFSSNILNNLPNLKLATALFDHCSGLTSIPSGIFNNCPKITSFEYLFNECPLITSIPNGLFNNCPLVTNFSNAFNNCYALTNIPKNLFTKNTLVTNFYGIFGGCISLTGTVPYDNGSGSSTPLYQRSSGVNGYARVTSYGRSFERCTKLSDYASIPSEWKTL